MKYFFVILSCLACRLGSAETIQNVEYHLPKVATNWVVGNKLESEKGMTIIYIPESAKRQNTTEFFGVKSYYFHSNLGNPEDIKSGLTKMFPHMHIDFRILEKDKDSILYEWSAQENHIERIHGWGRIFSNEDSLVTLSYETNNISNIEQVRLTWLQALKDAKQF